MAAFYPSKVTNFHGSEGEKLVWCSLHRLPDSYTVFYSYRWLGTISQRRSEGEADFVVLHPSKGVLSIEVKAGDIAYRNGSWIQINRHTGEEKGIDPFGQAAESQHRIADFLRECHIPTMPLLGRAVWFTSVALGSHVNLPMEAVPELVLDEGALKEPEEALDRAYEYWRQTLHFAEAPKLTKGEFDSMVSCLMPSFHLTRTISSTNLEAQTSFVQLTRQQAAILDFLAEQRTAAIQGPAGTGKTLLAVEKTRRLAAEGRKVLYLCYNEFLLSFIRKENTDVPASFYNVRSLSEELMGKKSENPAEQVKSFDKWFAEDFQDDDWPYTDIVVDEGQDLTADMLEHLSFLAELGDGTFYIFYDGNQRIIRREKKDWIHDNAECRLVLYRDCRNTAEIASSMASVIGMKRKDHYVNKVHGPTPKVSFYRDPGELQSLCGNFVKEMGANNIGLEDMVILSVHGLAKCGIRDVKKLGGVPVSNEPKPGTVWLTNVYRYKGLEAKAVLLIDVGLSELDKPLMRRLIYTGGSRANTYLKVAFCADISKSGYETLIFCLGGEGKKRKDLAALFEMEIE